MSGRSLNGLARSEPALYAREYDPSGFRWIDANDADHNVLSFARFNGDGSRILVCIANLSASNQGGYRIGVPREGAWEQVLDTSSSAFGGLGSDSVSARIAEPVAWHGLDQSVVLDLPPLSVIWLVSG